MEYTKESLQNTWGLVQSKEHAEFIVEMAELHGFELIGNSASNKNFFQIGEDTFAMLINEPKFKGNCKQITIPLPPKGKPSFSDLPKHFDCRCNKCGGKCCAGFCDTWPKIGDEVYVTKKVLDSNSMRESAELISETYCRVISKFTHNGVEFCVLKNNNSAYTSLILDLCLSDKTIVKSKTKSAQELKIEELQTKLCENDAVDNYILACGIVMGNIEGLSYE